MDASAAWWSSAGPLVQSEWWLARRVEHPPVICPALFTETRPPVVNR
jgi:hypothetical protein